MMRSLFTVLSLLLLADVAPARAAAADDCTPEHAVRMSFHDAYWYDGPDRCVRLQGLIAWRAMYASTYAYYGQRHARRVPGLEKERIGIYPNSDKDGDRLWAMRSVVDAVGRLTTCRRMYDRATGGHPPVSVDGNGTITITMMGGLCHYQGGVALVVTSYTARPDASARLAGSEAARLYGDLRPLDPSPDQQADADRWLAKIASSGHGPTPLSPIKFFTYADNDNRIDYACVCTRGSCANEWPISYGDVGPQSDPPYRCATLGTYGVSDAW
jgi:hypothetical protein